MIKELENKLHTQIPLTKLMELKIINYDEELLKTTAPLSININDKINFNYSWSNYLNENNDFIKGCKLANKIASEVVQVQGSKISKECFNKYNI